MAAPARGQVWTMSRAAVRSLVLVGVLAAVVATPAIPAAADHTRPREPLVPLEPRFEGRFAITRGEGAFTHVLNIPAPTGTTLSGSGTDHKVFRIGDRVYASVGTLGQDGGSVGQRILLLMDGDNVKPRWIADHGSAACRIANPSITGLQHDAAVLGMPSKRRANAVAARSLTVVPELIVDSTDATGRCHDPGGGGLELIDVTGLRQQRWPREVHLVRHAGFSHTVTVDDRRPWIAYNSSSDLAGRPWIDVIDARSCLGLGDRSLNAKRKACRPEVFRIPFEPEWSRQVGADGELVPGTESACHDITSRGTRLYCAAPNATLLFDVRGLTTRDGSIRGKPLPCPVIDGTATGAKVTDCGAVEAGDAEAPVPSAKGWRFLGRVNHVGRNCAPLPTLSCNSNTVVPPDAGIAFAHEADPTPDGDWMFVTDERGGGVIPGGASCAPGADNPVGHGGVHVFDTRNPRRIEPARTVDGAPAVWFGEVVIPAATFCDVHVIEQVTGEQRLVAAYYSQGTKILDWFIDPRGRWSFRETASIVLPNANTWAVDVFHSTKTLDGNRTYWFIATDINRGIDIFTWNGPPNPMGTKAPASLSPGGATTAGMLDATGLLLASAAAVCFATKRRRRYI